MLALYTLLRCASGCAFRWGGAPDVPVIAGTRVVVDPSGNLAAAAIEAFRADARFVVVDAVAPELSDPTGTRCLAETTPADLVVRIHLVTDVAMHSSVNAGGSGKWSSLGSEPAWLWYARAHITAAFSHAGTCKPFYSYSDPIARDGIRREKFDEAERDLQSLTAEQTRRVPAFLRDALGAQGVVIDAAGDRGTLSLGHSEGVAAGDIIELRRAGSGHAGTAVVTDVNDSRSAIEGVGGEAPSADMIATRRTSATTVEILPVGSVFSTTGYVGAGLRVEAHGVLRSPMFGFELSALGSDRTASAFMPSAYVGYLWEPRPRWLGLYVKAAAGALVGSADAALESASLGAKLRTPIVMFDLEAGYFVTEGLATSDAFRWGNGPLVRLGVGFELR